MYSFEEIKKLLQISICKGYEAELRIYLYKKEYMMTIVLFSGVVIKMEVENRIIATLTNYILQGKLIILYCKKTGKI